MPTLRTDILDAYLFRASPRGIQFLQLLRSQPPLAGSWQPVMGHINPGETAVAAAIREIAEETALNVRHKDCLGFWALESVHPFFLPGPDAIILSPCFAAHAPADWSPTLNEEHSSHRWILEHDLDANFMWPGQRAACREVISLALTGILTKL